MKLYIVLTLLVSISSIAMAQSVDSIWGIDKNVKTIVKKSYPAALNNMNQSYKNINAAMDSALDSAQARCENFGRSFAVVEKSEKKSYIGGGNYSWSLKAVASCKK